MKDHQDFFSYVSDHFKTTYWVPGNHEYYYFDAASKTGVLNEKIRENVFLVNNTIAGIDGHHFIFSTLWSKISPARQWDIENGMSDFKVIRYNGKRFTTKQFNQLHEESLSFIKQAQGRHTTGKSLIVTHHVPTFLNYPSYYKGSILNEAFAVELFDFIENDGPDYWIFGHHHYNAPEFKIGKTTLLTNQLGYVEHNEHQLFKQNLTISV
jgi:predicted phosphohydrolase